MRKVQKYRNIWLFFDRPPTSHWYASARGTILNYDGANVILAQTFSAFRAWFSMNKWTTNRVLSWTACFPICHPWWWNVKPDAFQTPALYKEYSHSKSHSGCRKLPLKILMTLRLSSVTAPLIDVNACVGIVLARRRVSSNRKWQESMRILGECYMSLASDYHQPTVKMSIIPTRWMLFM